MPRNTIAKTAAQYLIILIAVPGLAGGSKAAQGSASIPDLAGMWGRNSFAYENPNAGLGPVENASRLASGARPHDIGGG